MLSDYLSPETYSFISEQISKEITELYSDPHQLDHEIEKSSDYMDLHLQIKCWLEDGSLYQTVWQLRQWMPSSFSCFTDSFVWQVYKEIACIVIYNYISFAYYD